jgi:5-methylcytosine-specific restriction protein B
MHSTLRIRDYVFHTSALRDAVETIDLNEASVEEGYSKGALYALFDYFCDWGPVRESDINASVSEELGSVSGGEREALFNDCCDRLAENLWEQYSMSTDAETIGRVASILASDESVTGKYDFLIRYLWQFSKHLAEFDPEENQAISGVQEFLNATRNLPREFLQAKESQYAGSVKVNKIRYRLLKKFHVDGKIEASVLENIKTEVKREDGETILQNWRDYTILGQIYYDYFKPRLDHYLQTLANRIVDEFSELELTTHIVNFQGAQSYLDDFAWIAAHTPPSRSQKDKYQLYLGIHASHLRYGLHVGSNLREGDWETDRDLDQVEDLSTIHFEEIVGKLRSVEGDFRRLEGLEMKEGGDEIETEQPSRADEIGRQLNAKKQVVFYGPPGTGKTYVAQQFAHWWTAEQDVDSTTGKRVRTVTFHPSFTYEDFVEGLSAESTDEGDVAYEVQDGILKTICKAARADYQQTSDEEEAPRYVLIIDEINRGNLAQIFGETITLLEADKRGNVSVQLAHSGSEFTIPPNLYVIGTMNTADRSIALVDAALRRRFRFIGIPPDYDVLCEHHQIADLGEAAEIVSESTDPNDVLPAISILALQQINESIRTSPELGKGKQIGHSYLMNVDGVESILDAWRYDILPLLEEYYFGQFDRIQQEIFSGAGGELIDWEREQIRSFTATDLVSALSAITDLDAVVEDVNSVEADDPPDYSKYPNAIQEAQEQLFPRIKETLHAENVSDVSHEEYNRRGLRFTSNHPDHPDEITYRFKPAPERFGSLRIGLDTHDDGRELFDLIVSNAELFEEEGFEVEPADSTNYRYFVVSKEYELEDAERGVEGPEVVAELLDSDLFDRALDDMADLIELTHRLFSDGTLERPDSTEEAEAIDD